MFSIIFFFVFSFFFSSRRRHTRYWRDWSSDVCSSDLSESEILTPAVAAAEWLRGQQAQEIALFVRPSTRREFADLSCLPEQAEAGAAYEIGRASCRERV